MPEHRVKQGESIASLAAERGLLPQTIWQHPENTKLRDLRKDPEVLAPGDIVFLPEPTVGKASTASTKRHSFKRKGQTARLRVQLRFNDEPRRSESYQLEVGSASTPGTTDGEGWIDEPIDARATSAVLVFEDGDRYELEVGKLDPVEEPTGVQTRLRNLGLYAGQVDGDIGDLTRTAIRRFQRREGLEETGELCDATRDALKQAHEG